jgi:hypothetical protein
VCIKPSFDIVRQARNLPSTHRFRFFTVVPEIKKMHAEIKKGIIDKYSPMINAIITRDP